MKRYSPALAIIILFALCVQALAQGSQAQGAQATQAQAQSPPPPSAEVQQAAARLAGSILVQGRSMDYLKNLTDRFGGRLSGSPAYERSAEWAAGEFRAAGLRDVRLEPFTIDNGWTRGRASGRILAPFARTLHIESLGWSPPTPAGGVNGEVLLVGDVSPEGIRAQADKIKGRLVLIDTAAVFAQGFKGFAMLVASQSLFKDAGALAVILPDNETNNVLNAFNLNWGAKLNPLPFAQIGMEDGKFIARLLKESPQTPVRLEFQIENQVSGTTTTHNVVAEIRGRERPDEWIIIGAHLDSWDYGTGAQDNGTGVVMVLEAARAIAALGVAPRRSIRFALWGGEEQGLLGSAAYVRAHASELAKCVAVLNTDNGAGHPHGWKTEGREDVMAAMRPISDALLRGLNGNQLSLKTTFDTDHGHFMIAGIPSLDLLVDMEPYGKVHHKSSDTFDKVDAHNLAAGAAIVAITAEAIAERPDPLASRIERKAVGELLKRHQLEEFLTAVGVWKAEENK